jgi:hypothetical protein
MKWLKLLGVVAFGIYAIWGSFDSCRLWLFNGADLLFHEAGHLILRPLGEFAGICGGTLGQLVFPAIVTVYFLVKRDRYSAAFGFFWIGINCFQIAVYIRDARAQVLPLVGGDIHDWGYLLGRLGLLAWDHRIGDAVWCAGFTLLIYALWTGCAAAFKEPGEGTNSPETMPF